MAISAFPPRGRDRHRARWPRLVVWVPLVLLPVAVTGARAQDVSGEPIRLDQTIEATLAASDPVLEDGSHYHLYRFEAAAGSRLIITLRSDDFDAFLALGQAEDGGFGQLASDDDGGGGTDARIVWTAGAAGTYLIRANSFHGGRTGRYTLSLESAPAQVARVPLPIALGQTVTGALELTDPTLDDESPYHPYVFRAEEGDRVVITLRSPDFDAYLYLGRMIGDEFEVLETNDDGAGSGTDARIRWTAPSSGDYVIRANALHAGGTGHYTLSVEPGQPPVPVTDEVAEPVRPGQVVRGALSDDDPVWDDGSHYDLFRFEAERGDRFEITLRSDDFDALLFLGWAADGDFHELARDDDGAGGTDSRIEWTAPGAGTYLIRATSLFSGRSGRYTLTIGGGPGS